MWSLSLWKTGHKCVVLHLDFFLFHQLASLSPWSHHGILIIILLWYILKPGIVMLCVIPLWYKKYKIIFYLSRVFWSYINLWLAFSTFVENATKFWLRSHGICNSLWELRHVNMSILLIHEHRTTGCVSGLFAFFINFNSTF